MKNYIGVKEINAKPMTRREYAVFLHHPIDSDDEEGYLVEYKDGGVPNTKEFKGYVSWSPKGVFERAYRPASSMNFGLAIEAMRKGRKVSRSGWNGKGIFIELQRPTDLSKMTSPYIFINTTGLQTDNDDAPKSLVPWIASQTDMLADDWVVV